MRDQNLCIENKKDILKRLNRIEGQVKGIHRMVQEEKSCVDILTQVAAVRSAVNRVGGLILERYSKDCFEHDLSVEDRERKLEELVSTVQKFLNFVD